MNGSLVIVGTGGQASVVREIAELMGVRVAAYWNDEPTTNEISGVPVTRDITEYMHLNFVLALGDNSARSRFARRVESLSNLNQVRWVGNLVHPSAVVSASATIGLGTVIHAGAIVGPGSTLGRHCIVNSQAIVEHDCVVGDFASLAPAAVMGGGARLHQGAFLGLNATLLQGRQMGEWSVAGAASLLLQDVAPYSLMYGVPASFIRVIDETYTPFSKKGVL